MSSLIGDERNSIQVMKACNEGDFDRAFQLCNISGEPMELEGDNIVDNFVEVANASDNLTESIGGLLVAHTETKSISESVEKIMKGLLTMSENIVNRRISKIMTGTNFLLEHPNYISFLAEDDFNGISDDDAEAYIRAGRGSDDVTILSNVKDTIKEWYEEARKAFSDFTFRNTAIYRWLLNNPKWVIGGTTLTALGVVVAYIAYTKWKKNNNVSVEEVEKSVEDIPNMNITNESVAFYMSLLAEDVDDVVKGVTRGARDLGNDVSDTAEDAWTAVKRDVNDGAGSTLDHARYAGEDFITDVRRGARDLGNEVGDFFEDAMDKIKDFGGDVSEFFQGIPEMVKKAMDSLKEQIDGKEVYVGLIASALVAATAIYAIYKIYNRPKPVKQRLTDDVDEEDIDEVEEAFYFIKEFHKHAMKFVNEEMELTGSGNQSYSKYLSGAVDAAETLSGNVSETPYSSYFSTCVAKMAQPYNEMLMDMSHQA